MDESFFSVIVPVKAINDFVRENVREFLSLDYRNWEILVITNLDEASEWKDERIKFFSSGRVSPAIKRNIGAEKAKGDILLFLDDDSYPDKNVLQKYDQFFRRSCSSCAGGPGITPQQDGFLAQISGAFFESRFLGGNPERYRSIGGERKVNDWPSVNFAVRKSVFQKVGGFDTDFWPGEDSAFCRNLALSNFEINYLPDAVVFHHRRNSMRTHIGQISGYGFHRGYFARELPENSRKLKYFLPSIVTGLFISLTIGIGFNPQVFLPLGLVVLSPYFLVVALGFVDVLIRSKLKIAVLVVPLAVASHLVYGYRFIRGFTSLKKIVSKLR